VANTLKVKRSAIAGKIPLVSDLELGELAINTYDGKLFLKKNINGTEEVVDVSSGVTAQGVLDLIKLVDGAGSGLDADLLDGLEGADYARSGINVDITSLQSITGGISTAQFLDFTTTNNVTPQRGRLWYNPEDDTLNIGHDNNIVQQVGQEFYFPPCKNTSGATIPNGSLVMATGAQGDKITVAPAITNGTVEPEYIIGVTTHEVTLDSEFATIVTDGVVRDLNTTLWPVGTLLYPDPNNPGQFVSTIPSSPAIKTPIAIVLRQHESTGRVYVRMTTGSKLGATDSNVQFTPLANNDLIVYNSTLSRWENKKVSDLPTATTSLAGVMSSTDKTKLDGIAAGAQVNVATNLGYTTAASTGTVTSSTGTNATIPAATTSLAGLLTSTDKTKLDGIAAGAQVNVATNLGVTQGTTAGPIITSSTGTNVTLPTASATASGVVTTGDQTWVGEKTFSRVINGSIVGLNFADTREVNDLPQQKLRNSITADFKANTSVGGPPVTASSTYSHIVTVAGWNSIEGSGGWPTQLSIGADGIAYRQATTATTWGAWNSTVNTSGNQTIAGAKTFSSTITGSISGNAGTVTNGVYTTGSYADPAWITSINYSKLTGTVPTWNQNTTGSAATLTTGRTIGMTGDVTWTSASFNGSANVTGTATLANSGVTAGTYTKVTVDAKGRATSGTTLVAADIPNLDASKLTTGTLADARLSGTYSGFTHKIDGSNTVYTTPSSGSTNTVARTVYGLAEYRSGASAQIGALVFIAPNTTSTIMHQLEVQGLLYNQNIFRMTVQGYRTTGAWTDLRKISSGTVDIQTRWGVTPDGKNCLILGDIGTSWSYPHISIVRALFSHGGLVDSYCTDWTVAVVTDLSTYTNVTGTISGSILTGSVSGNAATATTLQTARTINGTSFNGSANITTANWGTARTLTIGSTGKSVDGSANVSWTLAEIGAQAAGNYVTTNTTQTISGAKTFSTTVNATTFNATSTIGGGFQGIDEDTATAPSFTWTADLDTGIFRPGADIIGFTAGNAERARITTVGLSGNTLGVSNTTSTTGAGISLYSGAVSGQPTYGLMFAGTGTFGTHGGVTADWATYFTMNNAAGRGWIFKTSTGTAGNVASINTVGTATFAGNVAAASDARLKKDLCVIENAVNKVSQLTGYTYTRIDSGERQTGLIAQDVEKVLPEAVISGSTLSLAYGNMVGLLVEAIKEQQQIITKQESRLAKLESLLKEAN